MSAHQPTWEQFYFSHFGGVIYSLFAVDPRVIRTRSTRLKMCWSFNKKQPLCQDTLVKRLLDFGALMVFAVKHVLSFEP